MSKSLSTAYSYCIEPAQEGNPNSMIMLAEIVLNIQEAPFKEDKKFTNKTAFKLYRRAAEKGHPHGQYMLSVFYVQGIGTTKNQALAFEWLTKSSALGHKQASEALLIKSNE